jgi:hypothetical protein
LSTVTAVFLKHSFARLPPPQQFRELGDVCRRIDAEAATVNPFAADAERLREALAAGAARLGALADEKAKAAAEVDR